MCLRIWSHLLKKSLMENFIFCAVYDFECNQSGSQIFLMQLTINLTSSNKGVFKFTLHKRWSFPLKISSVNMSKSAVSFSYHESNLSLVTPQIMRLLINDQFIPFQIRPKSISFEQRSPDLLKDLAIVITLLCCPSFLTSKKINK